MVSDEQRRDSGIQIHVSIPPRKCPPVSFLYVTSLLWKDIGVCNPSCRSHRILGRILSREVTQKCGWNPDLVKSLWLWMMMVLQLEGKMLDKPTDRKSVPAL